MKHPKPPTKPLNKRQLRFIAEYMVDLSPKNAAIRAGYSKHSAVDMGAQNMAHPLIAAEIAKRQERRANKLELTAENVLREIGRVALSDTRRLYREDGSLKPANEWDDDMAAAVAGVEVKTEFVGRGSNRKAVGFNTKSIKLWDKNAALDKAARHLGLYERDNAQRGPDLALQVVLIGPP